MNKIIQILHLEDSAKDFELIHSIIENGRIEYNYFWVDNEKDYLHILETESIDIILSDYSLPGYSGNEALEVVRNKYSHIPFLFVSGVMGEDAAINSLVNGATDYALKNKLERLIPAIKRAIHEYQIKDERKQAEEALTIANTELIFQNNEKEKRATELLIANTELAFQNEEKGKRADELIIANTELVFQNEEKEKRAAELIIANEELVFQNNEKEKRAAELVIANEELAFQNNEKEKRAAELVIANEELAFQNNEKEKRAAELVIANEELAFQNNEKEKRAAELLIANEELVFQNNEKEKRATELIIANTELVIAKEHAEESDRLKTAFLQNMSHEIRTPLNGIIGFSGLLNDENISKEDIKEFTDMINQCGKRLIEIVNNVLDISKIQTGQCKIENRYISLNSIFFDLLNFFTPLAKTKNIQLNYQNLDDINRTIFSDEAKLNQILTNLVNNAIKFTESGSIDIGYEIKDSTIQFYVKDTGIGISAEVYDKIFDRFTQADQSLSRGYEGAGLGLAICKALVEMLGGRIWVKSEVNKGTTFFFTLPNTPIDLPSKTSTIFSINPKKRTCGKILIAEDNWASSQYLRKLLESSDITVIQAENGENAVELVRNMPEIDLILMDIKMPVMDGIEATKQIKQIRPDLPIIAQTAYVFSEEIIRILDAGCDEYLAKPLEINKLMEMIDKYMK